MNDRQLLLVGDNPFHGISHLSQERAISRGKDLANPGYCAELVGTALDSGAGGFMFSVSTTTLSVLKSAYRARKRDDVRLYAIVPYMFEFVRLAVSKGGIPGLAKEVGREIVNSVNFRAIINGMKGLASTDPASLFKAYLLYEESRIRLASGKSWNLDSILLHEVLTDMALALDMGWLFRVHIDLMTSRGIKPGFHTHNLPCLVKKLNEWGIDSGKLAITTQFNSLGFGMCPSREECEEALRMIPEAEVIAFGILASGYLKPAESIEYIAGLPNISGVVVGVSKENHARETFNLLRGSLVDKTSFKDQLALTGES